MLKGTLNVAMKEGKNLSIPINTNKYNTFTEYADQMAVYPLVLFPYYGDQLVIKMDHVLYMTFKEDSDEYQD